MLVVLWEYLAKPERVVEFESFYRPEGPWGELFRDSPAFISTTLMKDLRDPVRFMVADRWTSEPVYQEFQRERATIWQALSERGRRLYDRETEMGRFGLPD